MGRITLAGGDRAGEASTLEEAKRGVEQAVLFAPVTCLVQDAESAVG